MKKSNLFIAASFPRIYFAQKQYLIIAIFLMSGLLFTVVTKAAQCPNCSDAESLITEDKHPVGACYLCLKTAPNPTYKAPIWKRGLFGVKDAVVCASLLSTLVKASGYAYSASPWLQSTLAPLSQLASTPIYAGFSASEIALLTSDFATPWFILSGAICAGHLAVKGYHYYFMKQPNIFQYLERNPKATKFFEELLKKYISHGYYNTLSIDKFLICYLLIAKSMGIDILKTRDVSNDIGRVFENKNHPSWFCSQKKNRHYQENLHHCDHLDSISEMQYIAANCDLIYINGEIGWTILVVENQQFIDVFSHRTISNLPTADINHVAQYSNQLKAYVIMAGSDDFTSYIRTKNVKKSQEALPVIFDEDCVVYSDDDE